MQTIGSPLMLNEVFINIGISDSWVVALLGWPSTWFGNEMFVRFLHHVLMWVIILFSMIHIYLVFFHDYVEGRGETSSIISGWKFIEERIWKKHDRQKN